MQVNHSSCCAGPGGRSHRLCRVIKRANGVLPRFAAALLLTKIGHYSTFLGGLTPDERKNLTFELPLEGIDEKTNWCVLGSVMQALEKCGLFLDWKQFDNAFKPNGQFKWILFDNCVVLVGAGSWQRTSLNQEIQLRQMGPVLRVDWLSCELKPHLISSDTAVPPRRANVSGFVSHVFLRLQEEGMLSDVLLP